MSTDDKLGIVEHFKQLQHYLNKEFFSDAVLKGSKKNQK